MGSRSWRREGWTEEVLVLAGHWVSKRCTHDCEEGPTGAGFAMGFGSNLNGG